MVSLDASGHASWSVWDYTGGWMRHYTANLVAIYSKARRPAVMATLHSVYEQRSASSADAQSNKLRTP